MADFFRFISYREVPKFSFASNFWLAVYVWNILEETNLTIQKNEKKKNRN